jgi:hypothetical protein
MSASMRRDGLARGCVAAMAALSMAALAIEPPLDEISPDI